MCLQPDVPGVFRKVCRESENNSAERWKQNLSFGRVTCHNTWLETDLEILKHLTSRNLISGITKIKCVAVVWGMLTMRLLMGSTSEK